MSNFLYKQVIEILATLVILVILLCILAVPALAIINSIINKNKKTEVPTKAFELYTGQHDGHLWILNRTSSYFLHHPDCTCGKVEKDE